ncbi:group I intron-associated PD-(D/E)XK endonuclease [Micromonospora sp. DT227]|uniref:group I intron-associated PD-(D/E)XK endonuclease n=1 Tax=Micromonospora sp. DT227 TaxID=3393433 RepID=UPI003CFAD84E
MSRDTTTVGNRTEGIVLAALMQAGKSVLLPFGGGHAYDLAVDDGGTLIRVQCKTAFFKAGSIVFNARSVNAASRANMPYQGRADVFGVYSAHTGKVYLVPVAEIGTAQGYLRVDPVRNGQSVGIRWAADYELAAVAQ